MPALSVCSRLGTKHYRASRHIYSDPGIVCPSIYGLILCCFYKKNTVSAEQIVCLNPPHGKLWTLNGFGHMVIISAFKRYINFCNMTHMPQDFPEQLRLPLGQGIHSHTGRTSDVIDKSLPLALLCGLNLLSATGFSVWEELEPTSIGTSAEQPVTKSICWYLTNSVFFTNLKAKNNMKKTGIGRYVVTNEAASNVPTVKSRAISTSRH